MSTCPLCTRDTQAEIWSNAQLRVIDAKEPGFPGFTRVIWHDHVREMTDLAVPDRLHLMEVVWVVETTLREQLTPTKINLAQFGNMVPHVHWHVIPRWFQDERFPDAVWAAARSRTREHTDAWETLRAAITLKIPDYHHALKRALDQSPALR